MHSLDEALFVLLAFYRRDFGYRFLLHYKSENTVNSQIKIHFDHQAMNDT